MGHSSIRLSTSKPVSRGRRGGSAHNPRSFHSNAQTKLLALQSVIGNQGMIQMLQSGMGRSVGNTFGLAVSRPGDRLERQADRVADALVPAQSNRSGDASSRIGAASRSPAVSLASQRETAMRTVFGNGHPLRKQDQHFFESKLGRDFSGVRIHSDTQGSELAVGLNARAFTIGRHVVFGDGEYTPQGTNGKRLLAHELTHVVQQENGLSGGPTPGSSATVMRTPQPGGTPNEGPQLRLPQLGESLSSLGQAPERPSLLGSDIPKPVVTRRGGAVSATIFFGQDNFLMDAANLSAVQQLNEQLRIMFEPTVTVAGHASTEGKEQHNQELSERRRQAVIAILSSGLQDLPTFGGAAHGELQPAVPETGDAPEPERAGNRRVEITIFSSLSSNPSPDAEQPSNAPKIDLHLRPRFRPPLGGAGPLRPERPSLSPNFWNLPPMRQPPSRDFLNQLSRWLTGELGRRDIARMAGRIAGGLGMNEAKVQKKLDDAMVSGGEAGLKAALRALIEAIAGSPTSRPRSPTGPAVSEIPGPRVFNLPPIRF